MEQCTQSDDFVIYRSEDPAADISIYCGDYFKCNVSVLGRFDVIWDALAYASCNVCERYTYIRQMCAYADPDTRYCLNNVTLDQSRHREQPFSSSHDEICDKFGGLFDVDRQYFYENATMAKKLSLDSYVNSVYLLRLRGDGDGCDCPPVQVIDLMTGKVTREG